jgi:hypothetical protein
LSLIREVQRRDRSAGDADHPQLRQTADEGRRKRRALSHRQENIEIGQRRRRLVLRAERVGKKHQFGAGGEGRPVSALARDVLPVVQDSNLDHDRF